MAQAILNKSLESRIGAMSPRSLETLALIASGATNPVIAERLGIAEKIVDRHINSIYNKLGISEDDNLNQRVKAALLYLERFPEDKGKYQRELFGNLEIRPLTQREYEALSLAAQGYSNAYISEKLFVEERTVERHINAIYKKLNIHSYEGTNPRVLAMLMFDRVPKPEGYKPVEPQLVPSVGK